MSEERTEQATPKRKQDARKKGQVARSFDVNSAAVLLGSIVALTFFGPGLVSRLETVMREGFARGATPDTVSAAGIADIGIWAIKSIALAGGPLILAIAAIAVLSNIAQVGLKLTPLALKPTFSKINALQGLKRLFGKNAAVEGLKALAKAVVIGFAAWLALRPRLEELAALTGASPRELFAVLVLAVRDLAWRVGLALVVLAAVDWAWQRYSHRKQLRMTKEEVRQEHKQQDTPPELKRALRRRQFEMSRTRMLAEVLTADVVVVNPTHYAAALRYDGSTAAPQLVAKGVDHLAAAIREKAKEARVPIVSNPPLARTLYAEVELNAQIPEGLFTAVAEVLAFVYRTAGRRRRTLKQTRRPPMTRRHAVG